MVQLEMKATVPEVRKALPSIKAYIHAERNDLKYCPFCNSHIEDREESIYAELIEALYRVYRWCGENKLHEFDIKEIRHLLSKVDYARFGNLIHYGGIVYAQHKAKRGKIGINMARAKEFFSGKRMIPYRKVIDLITGETIAETCVYVHDIPHLAQFIGEDGVYSPAIMPEIGEGKTFRGKRTGIPMVQR